MLIVGQITDDEEEYEVRCIAQIFSNGERVRYLARQQRKK
jgi:hypothetical protein